MSHKIMIGNHKEKLPCQKDVVELKFKIIDKVTGEAELVSENYDMFITANYIAVFTANKGESNV